MAWWFWVILGLALLGLELAMPGGFFLVFFGISGFVLGLITVAVPDLSVGIAWLLFTLLATVLLLAFRQRLIKTLGSSNAGPIDSLIGQDVELSEDIAPGAQGGVILRGAPWRAVNGGSQQLTAGSRSRVTAVDGLILKIG